MATSSRSPVRSRRSLPPAMLLPGALGLVAMLSGPVQAQVAGTRRPATPGAGAAALPVAGLPAVPAQGGNRQTVALESGNGRILTLPGPATNVFVADPKVAEVRPASTNSLFVFGVGPGRTTVAAMDAEGRPVSQFEVTVRPSTFNAGEGEAALARLLPNSRIRVTPQARGMLMTGNVETPAEAARAVAILKGFINENQVVENQLSVRASVQVNLRVRIVEMNRNVTRALGIDWQAMGSIGKYALSIATSNGLSIASPAAGTLGIATKDFNGLLDSLSQDNLLRVLAEPNLTVMSGEPGSFLAGGEFPIPVASAGSNGTTTVTIVFKKYGVNLSVVPTVLSDGRINLHVSPEVSQLSTTGAVNTGGGAAGNLGFSIPGLVVRRAETTVELGSGQSFALAGLLQDNVTQNTNGLAFLGDLPILGALFRSSAYQRQETELVMVVTPYIVRPVDDPGRLRTGGEKFQPPNDFERILLLRQTGAQQTSVSSRIPGAAGFIVQ